MFPIEGKPMRAYRGGMRLLALRMLALVAVMLMPFGMAAAPAAAVHHEEMSAAMPMEHCPTRSESRSTGILAHCAMACAAGLPAADLAAALSHPVARSSPETPAIQSLSGIEPEIATPPPRLA